MAFLLLPELQSILITEDDKDQEISVYKFEASRPLGTFLSCLDWQG